MLLSFFNKNTFANIIGVVFFALVLWFPAFIAPPQLLSVSFMPAYKTVVGVFGNNSFLLVFISFVCVLAQAFYFNFLVVKHNLFAKNGYMAAFIYSTLMSCSPTFLFFHPFTIGGFFVLLQIDLLITTYKKQDARTELFYVGLLCSLLTLLYNSYSLFLLFAFIAIALMRPLNWRDYFICFMGFLLPFLFVFTYYFWADSLGYFTITLLNFDFFDFVFEKISLEQWLFLCGLFLLVFFAVIRIVTRGLTIKTMLVRKTFSLLFWLLLCGLAIGLFINLPNMSSFSVTCIPVTVFLSNQYLNSKKLFWSEVVFGLFFLGCVFKNALFFGLF